MEEKSPTHLQLAPLRLFLSQQYWIIRNLHTLLSAISSASHFQILYSANLNIRKYLNQGRNANIRIDIENLTVLRLWFRQTTEIRGGGECALAPVLLEVNPMIVLN